MSATRRQFLTRVAAAAAAITAGASLADPPVTWYWSGWWEMPTRPAHVGYWYYSWGPGTLTVECEVFVDEREMVGMTRVQRLLHMDRVKHEAYAGRHRGWYRDGRTGRLA